MEREIWFEKWLWSYVPCHWKGVAALFAVAGSTAATAALSCYVAGAAVDWFVIPVILAGLLTMLAICRRHSA